MRYRELGRTGLQISEIGLGSMMFGEKTALPESTRIMHQALDAGVNLIDTADVYSEGEAERFIGSALSGHRTKVIIATKVGRPTPLGQGLSHQYIFKAVEASLKRLQTDYIDLYQVHRWDSTVPLEETLSALAELVRQGKVRYIGCSNFEAWHLYKALFVSTARQLYPFASIQPRYNLIHRKPEEELLPLCIANKVGVLAYSPLGGGVLTGKYLQDIPQHSRGWQNPDWQVKRLTAESQAVAQRVVETANHLGCSPTHVAIRWCLANPAVTCALVGPRTDAQWQAALEMYKHDLTPDQAAYIANIAT